MTDPRWATLRLHLANVETWLAHRYGVGARVKARLLPDGTVTHLWAGLASADGDAARGAQADAAAALGALGYEVVPPGSWDTEQIAGGTASASAHARMVAVARIEGALREAGVVLVPARRPSS